jgi:hypothetical protein
MQAAEQQLRDRARGQFWDGPEDDAQVERNVADWMADQAKWVRAGCGQPTPCRLSYPRALLRAGWPELLDWRDVDCSEVLLSTVWQRPPKHLCFGTAVKSTRKFALKHFPPSNDSQELWARSWPFPVGEAAIAAFAKKVRINRAELPAAPDQEDPEAAVGLWAEQRHSQYSSLILLGYAQPIEGYLSKVTWSGDSWLWNLSRAVVLPRHASPIERVWGAEDSSRGEFVPEAIDRNQEQKELAALLKRSKELLRFFERGALQFDDEKRGRHKGSSKELLDYQSNYDEAVQSMYRNRGPFSTHRKPRPADLFWAFESLLAQGKLTFPCRQSTFYAWIANGQLLWPAARHNRKITAAD